MSKVFTKGKKGILGSMMVVVLSIMLIGCSVDLAEVMQGQLEEIDSTSFSEITYWIDNELPYFEEEGFESFIWSMDTRGDIVQEGILDNEGRFVEFTFDVGYETIWIDMIYLTLDDYLSQQLDNLDRTSLSAILDWIDANEDELDTSLWIDTVDTNGDWISDSILDDPSADELFVEWSVDIQSWSINVELVFETSMTFGLGDTFVAGGLEFNFGTDIVGGVVDSTWHTNYGELYFKVPVTMTNVSDESIDWFTVNKYGPDGTALDWFVLLDTDDDIERMGGLRPGASHEGYMYFLFEGDGEYVVEFWARPLTIELIFNVNSDTIDFPDTSPEEVEEDETRNDEDSAIVGTWLWLGTPYYVFNADGTGTMADMDITWSTSGGILTICTTPDICGNICILPHLWNYTISGNQLTLESRQVDDMIFTYTRQ